MFSRFERTGDPQDLDRAIDLGEKALDAAPGEAATQARLSNALGAALMRRHQRTGSLSDLSRAIDLDEKALDTSSDDDPQWPIYLSALGAALETRFERSGRQDDLEAAIDLCERALEAAPADHHDRYMFLSNVAAALLSRFECTGNLADLDRAIPLEEEAVQAIPVGHPGQGGFLSNLARALMLRFDHTGMLEDLDRAIDLGEQAVAVTGDDHPFKATFLSNVATFMRRRSERMTSREEADRAEDLDRAIDLCGQALDATPVGHPARPVCQCNLSEALVRRFEHSGNLDDLDRAIDLGEQALDATPAGHPDKIAYLSMLAVPLKDRFERTGNLEDLDHAIDLGEQAAAALPGGRFSQALVLSNLGLDLVIRFEYTGHQDDLDRGLEQLHSAAEVRTAPVSERAKAALRLGRIAVRAEKWPEAVAAYSATAELVGLVASRGLGYADREDRLLPYGELGTEAAAACIQAGQPNRAAELFEHARGVWFSQELDANSDLAEVPPAHAGLVKEFIRWRDEMERRDQLTANSPAPGPGRVSVGGISADSRWKASVEFDRVLTQIRALPGFDRFRAMRRVEELLPAAAEGPVVLINVARLRSDALIITADGVDVLPLEGVDTDEVVHKAGRFLDALHLTASDRAAAIGVDTAAEENLADLLGWLGDRITSPILDRLGYSAPPEDGVWPRVWWCPSGPLSILPLHAAGHHKPSSAITDAVIDRVISSTIPTLRSLLRARNARPVSLPPELLVVAMPHTPGQKDLQEATREAEILRHLFPSHVEVLGLPDGPPATHETVTAALPHHAWAHFACHGQNNLTDPSASQLLLSDYQTHPLTVTDLTRTRLEGAELAFLAARHHRPRRYRLAR